MKILNRIEQFDNHGSNAPIEGIEDQEKIQLKLMSQIDRYNAQTEKKKRSKNSYSFSWIESGGANLLSEVIEEEKRMANIE